MPRREWSISLEFFITGTSYERTSYAKVTLEGKVNEIFVAKEKKHILKCLSIPYIFLCIFSKKKPFNHRKVTLTITSRHSLTSITEIVHPSLADRATFVQSLKESKITIKKTRDFQAQKKNKK